MSFPPVQVLMVAEKPSIARTIAQALSQQVHTQRRNNHEVHFFPSYFFQMPCLIKVTSVVGHIFSTDFSPEYNGNDVDPIKLFDAPTIKKFSSPSSTIIQHLKNEAQGCNFLVLWLDNDREGENICFEVIQVCDSFLNVFDRNSKYIFRAKFSSITQVDIIKAYEQLIAEPDLNQSLAVDARQILDLKLGLSFSKFQTRYLQNKYNIQGKKKISYGPCQTPTLAFCVERHDEIENFKPQTYYTVEVNLSEYATAKWSKEQTFDQEEAKKVLSEVQQSNQLMVKSISTVQAIKSRPVGLNTVNMLRIASKKYEIGPHDAIHIAESLYLLGFITYPRTETTKYPGEFDFKSVLHAISNSKFNNMANYAKGLLSEPLNKPYKGVDSGDHPPITPTQNAPQSLNPQQMKIYELVCKNFLGSLSQDAQIENTTYILSSGQNEFEMKKSILLHSGYLDIVPWESVCLSNPKIEKIEEGVAIKYEQAEVLTLLTQPPSYLSESDLIGLMEQNGIGTDASMPQHINNIILRNYVYVNIKERQLIPTQLGIALIHAYKDIDNQLVAPELRRNMEEQISQIAKGQMTKDELVETQIKIFKQKYENFVSQSNRLDFHFDLIKSFLQDSSNEEENEEESQNHRNWSDKRGNQHQHQNYKHNHYQQNQHRNQYKQNNIQKQKYQNYQNNNDHDNNNSNSYQGQQKYQRKDAAYNRQNNQYKNQNKYNNNQNYSNNQQLQEQQFPSILDQLNPAKLVEQNVSDIQQVDEQTNQNQNSSQQKQGNSNTQQQQQQQLGNTQKKKTQHKKDQYVQKDKRQQNREQTQNPDQQSYLLASDCIEQQLTDMLNLKQTKKKSKKTLKNEENEQNHNKESL
ncbi:DNA topoisomerase I (macronuclear) [Tetrahymena thermophila SB210]|uniref:DNA topoisomerase n=1 Tax=Tetrahymena thermophila (strain SB210) TaxID=312017 RepID=I7LXJ3_TETTS|nr:DNA topoisomerase I [Tetrahymena thermophila SB210]EAS04751.2 DNA topoisomerase I [Tetrahymena thermophila SB210]|eukprot:XP_001024996.2 DNA topoisomerase I [Tetrahymena thermophila SB210]